MVSHCKREKNFFKHVPWNTLEKMCVVTIGKEIPGQALRIPEGWGFQVSRQSTPEGGKVVSPTLPPSFPHKKYSWYSFLLEAEYVNEKAQWPHRESNPRPFGSVPHPTVSPRAPPPHKRYRNTANTLIRSAAGFIHHLTFINRLIE
jgi:hypothetical protein